jgi:hypothetical protein
LTDLNDCFEIAIPTFPSILAQSTKSGLPHQSHLGLDLCGNSSLGVEFSGSSRCAVLRFPKVPSALTFK